VAVTKIDQPPGADEDFWKSWLRHRAATAPFVWPNHRDAVEKGFHLTGKSAVIVLPTGARKTTVSCLKIASVLASGKNVVFIAPTHALIDQLTVDLQEVFPEELLGSLVSSDFDRLFATGTTLRKIEVMTPERCLALLSYAPHAFEDVGLLVFDECHLLSPDNGLRRALDGMFCVLAFNSIAPDADFLFLSAMIRNGGQFAGWIGALTGRDCVFVDPLWKPSRQARGVVFYQKKTIAKINHAAMQVQREQDKAKGKTANGLRRAAKSELLAEPFALFGLQHNWLQGTSATAAITKISGSTVELNGELRGGRLRLKPNVNRVASHIAAA
jgi:replicative superfamily II helicase